MERKAQAALFWAPPPLIAHRGRIFLCSVKETDERELLVCMLVSLWHNSTKTFQAHCHYIYHSGHTRALCIMKYTEICNAHLCLVHYKAQIVYLCCTTKTRPEHVSVIEHTDDVTCVKNHEFQKCIFWNDMAIFLCFGVVVAKPGLALLTILFKLICQAQPI